MKLKRVKTRTERNRFVAFYVSEAEKNALVEAAKKRDMSISDYCRSAIFYDIIDSTSDGKEESACTKEYQMN